MRATGATAVHVPVIVLVPTVLVADAAAQVPDNAPVYPELQVGAHGVAPTASVAVQPLLAELAGSPIPLVKSQLCGEHVPR